MSGPTMIRLRDLGEWSGGNTPSKANSAYWENGTIPWVSPKDMKVEEITSSEDHITEAALNDRRVTLVPAGAVLFVTRSGILAHTLPVATTTIPVTINQDLKALTPKPGISPKYVAHAVRGASRRILKQCSKHGTTVASIETNALLDFEIPLVAPADQTRIVADIDKQFSRLDAAVTNLKRVKAHLKRYKAAVFKRAFKGELIPTEDARARLEGLEYETGHELLQRALLARRKCWMGKGPYRDPEQPDVTGLLPLPDGWVWARLDAVAAIKGGVTVDKKAKAPGARRVPYLRVANVQRGFLDLSEVKHIDASETEIEQLRLQAGDILFNEGGDRDKLGRGWIWEAQLPECIHQNHVFRARLYIEDLMPELISWWGNTYGKDYFLREGKQTTNLASINLTKLSAFPVPIPPPAEQPRLVAEVERQLSIVDVQELSVTKRMQDAQGLRGALLSSSFRPAHKHVGME